DTGAARGTGELLRQKAAAAACGTQDLIKSQPVYTDTMGRAGRSARNAMPSSTATISAQPGRQTDFLRSPADICIYGGAAGGGKKGGPGLEPLGHGRRGPKFTY